MPHLLSAYGFRCRARHALTYKDRMPQGTACRRLPARLPGNRVSRRRAPITDVLAVAQADNQSAAGAFRWRPRRCRPRRRS